MLTRMTEEDWATVLEVFRACRSRRGAKGRNDRHLPRSAALLLPSTTSPGALCPAEFGNWNSVWMVDSQTTNSALSATVS